MASPQPPPRRSSRLTPQTPQTPRTTRSVTRRSQQSAPHSPPRTILTARRRRHRVAFSNASPSDLIIEGVDSEGEEVNIPNPDYDPLFRLNLDAGTPMRNDPDLGLVEATPPYEPEYDEIEAEEQGYDDEDLRTQEQIQQQRQEQMEQFRENMRLQQQKYQDELNEDSDEEDDYKKASADDPNVCNSSILGYDTNIQDYLKKDKGNFIIQMPYNDNFECQSINMLQDLNRRTNPLNGTTYYDVFYGCTKDTPILGFTEEDYVKSVPYIKMGSPNFLVEKPEWLYKKKGFPPKPRIFKLIDAGDKPAFVSESAIIETHIADGDMSSMWHCNTGKMPTFRLEPIIDYRPISPKKKRKERFGGSSKTKRNNKKTKKLLHKKRIRKTNKKHTRKTNKRKHTRRYKKV